MHAEINALVQFLGQHNGGHPVPASLPTWLEARFQGHWHTSDPEQGSAYRSLDKQCLPSDVAKHLDFGDSSDYTIWVDPGCVCARFEARGRFTCIYGKLPNIYKHQRDQSETEEEALAGFYSPVKSNRAIAIVPPSARLAPSVAVAPPTPANLPSASGSSVTASSAPIHSPTPVRPSRSASPVSRSGSPASSSGASSLFSHARSVSSASSSSSAGPSRPSSAQSFVKEHLNGKVGVLGGGIMLGQNAEEEENSVNAASAAVAAAAEDTAALQADKSATSTPSASSSDSETTAQQQQKPRRRREHRGKRGSGKQAARERALAQKAPRWCALEHHHHASQQFNHHQAWYMQPNVNLHQYAY